MKLYEALDLGVKEFERATKIHGRFNSAHEGYAVIKEEFDELWDEIKKNKRDEDHMKREATQLVAMSLRFLVDIC